MLGLEQLRSCPYKELIYKITYIDNYLVVIFILSVHTYILVRLVVVGHMFMHVRPMLLLQGGHN